MSLVSTITEAWTGHYETRGTLEQADCVIGFSFGYRGNRQNYSPGLSNQDLAAVALKHYAHLPKILQFEIADAYCAADGEDCNKIMRITKHRQLHKYLDTFEVADQAKELMDEHGYHRPVLLAHPFHLPRVAAICQKLGFDYIATDELRGAVEFDPQSTQKWTRDLDHWRGYEPMAITFYKLKGYL